MNIQKDISWGMALGVWWHFFWRYVFFGMAGGIVAGIVIGFAGAMAGLSIDAVISLSLFLGSFMIIVIHVWVVRMILTKKNRIAQYRLVLVEDEDQMPA